MTPELHDRILHMLAGHRVMTLATNRADGWPEASTMTYSNDGLILYCSIPREHPAFVNIFSDSRVSVAISSHATKAGELKGLSLWGKARVVDDENECRRIGALFLEHFPLYAGWPLPDPANAPYVRIVPEFISLLDNYKGIGHSNVTPVIRSDLDEHVQTSTHKTPPHRGIPAVRPSGLGALSRFAPFYVRG